jgi:hypothetical protein
MEIADGFLVAYNCYDGQVYCYGKGRSETSVSAPDVAVPLGTPVLIKGTVTDQSPGDSCLGIPVAGTPAISDESMSDWMAYLYMQQPKPTDATGVKVRLTAIDPNNNWQDLGTAVSDDKGNFAISWMPPVPGVYTLTATFEGSNSYFSSDTGTSFLVSEAPKAEPTTTTTPEPTQAVVTSNPEQSTTPPPTVAPPPTSASPTETYIALGAIAIIVVVAVAVIVLKRRK